MPTATTVRHIGKFRPAIRHDGKLYINLSTFNKEELATLAAEKCCEIINKAIIDTLRNHEFTE